MTEPTAPPTGRSDRMPTPGGGSSGSAEPEPTDLAPTGKRRQLATVLKIVGIAVAIVAVVICVRALIKEWPEVSKAIRHANIGLLIAGFVANGLGMWFLAVLWWRVLAVFGVRAGLLRVSAWYFAGELGKYLPGGIWPVVGRGELARREGVPRGTAYATTLMSLGLMCVGGAFASALLVPFFAFDGGRTGPELLLLVLIPIGVLAVHPAVLGRLLRAAHKITKGKLDLEPPSWSKMLGLIAVAIPPWLAVGGAAVLVTQALGFEQQPARVAFAAVVAWIIGFLAIPVPAGAGIREVLFLLVSGLASGPATAVAAISRVFLLLVDAIGGVVGLASLRRRSGVRS